MVRWTGGVNGGMDGEMDGGSRLLKVKHACVQTCFMKEKDCPPPCIVPLQMERLLSSDSRQSLSSIAGDSNIVGQGE